MQQTKEQKIRTIRAYSVSNTAPIEAGWMRLEPQKYESHMSFAINLRKYGLLPIQ